MSRAASPSTGKAYGLVKVCAAWGLPRFTFYRGRASRPAPKRRGPVGLHRDAKLVRHIRALIMETPFTAGGYRKVWARLRFRGVRTSPQRTLRLLRENQLLTFQRPGNSHGPKAHDGTIKTQRVDEMLGTDMTSILTSKDGNVSVFFVIDHCSLECLGVHASIRGTRYEALEPIRQILRHSFAAFGEKAASGLTLRHDHGSQFVSHFYQDELKFAGIKSSPSYVREPQGNSIAERFVRFLKENLLWIRGFETAENVRHALLEFKETYNREWIVARHGYKTPTQVREAQRVALKAAA